MKSELTTVQPKAKGFPKLMRTDNNSTVILATAQNQNSITGTVVFSHNNLILRILEVSEHWDAGIFIDLPSTECVILSNE